jgi:hypothetical protein
VTPDLAKKLISDEELLPKLPHPISLAGKGVSKENLDALVDAIRMELAREKLEGLLRSQYEKKE